jgi:hypothetical protein
MTMTNTDRDDILWVLALVCSPAGWGALWGPDYPLSP